MQHFREAVKDTTKFLKMFTSSASFLALLFVLPLVVSEPSEDQQTGTKRAFVVYDRENEEYRIVRKYTNKPLPLGWIAEANFKHDVPNTGWAYLRIRTNGNFSDSLQAYAAGLLEGNLTATMIKDHRVNTGAENYCEDEEEFCKRLDEFMQRNWRFMDRHIRKSRHEDPLWHQVALTLEQLSGVDDAYYNLKFSGPRTTFRTFQNMLLNLFGDLMDLQYVLKKKHTTRLLGDGSCSALVKVLPGNEDLYVSHVTWNTYESMLRLLKRYDFQFRRTSASQEPVPGNSVSFSSYPGCLYSGDDFYITSAGLATLETTIDNTNADLWKFVDPDKIVMEWIRSVIANRLAKNGERWVQIFQTFNSGTYNNEWMVIDYKLFSKGSPLPKQGLLWVLEQLPGYVEYADMTDYLRSTTYWPSYNIPYFPRIFNVSGYSDQVNKYGDYFSYEKAPRAQIFRRDHGTVRDLSSMIKVMRYNNFTEDPLSICGNCTPPNNAMYAISARADLNDAQGIYPFPSLGHRSVGGTDMKLTTADLSRQLKFNAISGPTYDSLPPFQWSKTDFGNVTRHDGHPDLWKFPSVVTDWDF